MFFSSASTFRIEGTVIARVRIYVHETTPHSPLSIPNSLLTLASTLFTYICSYGTVSPDNTVSTVSFIQTEESAGMSTRYEPISDHEPRQLLRVGLTGDPVAHSYSPRFQQAAFDALGIPARYELWQTPASELPARVASLRASGCLGANITIPYKEAVLPLVDVVDPLAARIGAVNTIVHRNEYLYGYNTDAPGLLRALVEQG